MGRVRMAEREEAAPRPSTAISAPPTVQQDLLIAAMLLTVAVVVVGLHFGRYPTHDLSPTGWDIHAYVWQTKAIGHGSLSEVGARPGVPVLASLLRGVIPIDPGREMIVLPAILAVALGLAAATAVRMALDLPGWATPVVALMVGIWPTTQRGMEGYVASLMMLMLRAAGVAVLVNGRSRVPGLALATAIFAAACLSHVVFYVAFVGVAGLAVLLAVPAYLADRRAGLGLLATEAGATTFAVLGGGAVGAVALFGALGLRPGESADVSRAAFNYRSRTLEARAALHPRAFLPVGLVGTALAWGGRGSTAARALIRLGLAWSIVAGVGALASLANFPVPGARFIQFALPIPVLFGLGVVATVGVITRRRGLVWVLIGILAVLAFAASPREARIRNILDGRTVKRPPIWTDARAARRYLDRIGTARPVVFVVDEPGEAGAYTPRVRLYIFRSSVPDDLVTRTYVYMGTIENLEAGRPTLLHATTRWQRDYNTLSRSNWDDASPALAEGAVVLISRNGARDAFEAAVAQDPTREVSPGLYVLRGPVIDIGTPAPVAPFGVGRAALSALGFLALLMLAGWGWARWALRRDTAGRIDVLCLAPAVGAGLAVIPAFLLAAAGGDPRGPVGIGLLAGLALAGLGLARVRSFTGGSRP
jgi:hypothetical protein